jgi:hypothetical protein
MFVAAASSYQVPGRQISRVELVPIGVLAMQHECNAGAAAAPPSDGGVGLSWVIETDCQAPCQSAVATSLNELSPELASSGAVSILGWAGMVQPRSRTRGRDLLRSKLALTLGSRDDGPACPASGKLRP